MRHVRKRRLAKQDLDSHASYLGRKSGTQELELRFLDAAQATLGRLRDMPSIGSPVILPSVESYGVRKWPVHDFPDMLIFYREIPQGIEIIRVLHARQDWNVLLQSSVRIAD